MSHPEGEGAQSGAEGAQSGTGETTGTAVNPNSNDGTQGGTAKVYTQAEIDAAAAETETIRKRMSAADQRAAKLEAELSQLRDKDLPEAEKLKRDFEVAQEQVSKLQESNSQLSLENAFLKDNTYDWQNPARALKLVDLAQVTINDDGTVSGLKEALKALATSDPYLVKTGVEPADPPPPATATGNNGGSAGSRTASSKQLAGRLPALRTRVNRS